MQYIRHARKEEGSHCINVPLLGKQRCEEITGIKRVRSFDGGGVAFIPRGREGDVKVTKDENSLLPLPLH